MNIRYKNIVVCGDAGTGTSTLSKALAKKLGWQRVSGGEFFRKWTSENSVPLWNKMAVPDEIDKKFDQKIKGKLKNESNTVIDTHYGGWFSKDMETVFKILLVCPKETANKRILERTGKEKESLEEIEKRRIQLRQKFEKLYSKENYENPKIFNLVINTEKTSVEESLQKVLENLSIN